MYPVETCNHSLSHILAAAVLRVLPDVKLGIGPAIENGFYYDFLPTKENPLKESLFPKIEKEMRSILKKGGAFTRTEKTIAEATGFFETAGQPFKAELIRELAEKGNQTVSFYASGDFTDLCQGPHVDKIEDLRTMAFTLDRIAGAYWQGSEKNPMLQRIYALSFPSKEALDTYVANREEAARRDHRVIGAEMKLFASLDAIGRGLPCLLPRGATLRRTLERFVVDEELRRGYQHVYTADLGRKELYVTSGHWGHYQESMYPVMQLGDDEIVLRPMSCPHHFTLYNSEPRSYRDLPMRFGEIVSQFRREQSGELTGLIRMMMFHLADGHIVCTPEQVESEFVGAVELVQYIMGRLGIAETISYRASLHDPDDKANKYENNPEMWASSEAQLIGVLDRLGLQYKKAVGEAAFYGPKLDVQQKNAMGKEETIFTIQIDFVLPERFDMKYVGEDGKEHRPVAIHRSSIGCLERTMAFLIEHYAGMFPTWLAPVQVMVMSITDESIPYAKGLVDSLKKAGIRVEADLRNEKIGKKVREARLQRIPYLATVGKKEAESGGVSVRNRDTQAEATIPFETFQKNIVAENETYALKLGAEQAG